MGMDTVINMLGGLGLFLYGMKLLSDGLEKAAGAKLRSFLEFFTKNRFVGLLFGMFFTAAIQSSSAATVMVVSFVNAGLMNLYQAAGVIMGANIGTTITTQLVAFDLEQIAPLFLMAGVCMVMFVKKPGIKKIGEVVLGFGILFMGLSAMSSAMGVLKESEEITNLLASLNNPVIAIFIGFLVTAILQSSSVTVSIVALMASQGLLPLQICFFTILGCNIGSCVSALLASLGGKKEAKQAAMIHFLINVFGTLVIAIMLAFTLDYVVLFIEKISGQDMMRRVANAHTLFKIFQIAVMFPFTKGIVKLSCMLVRSDKKQAADGEYELQYIGRQAVFSPTTAVVEAIKELEYMGEMASNNLNRAMNCLITLDEEEIAKVYEVEKNIDFLNRGITNYLVKVNQTTLPVDDAKSIGGLFHVVNDIERIGDHAENVADAAKMRIENQVEFSKEGLKEMGDMLEMVNKIVRYSMDMFSTSNVEHLQEILELEDRIDEKERELQQSHVRRLTKNECTPEAGMIFSDIISGLERVADHATNIAFSILEEDPEEEELLQGN